jgi:hypothetical protein
VKLADADGVIHTIWHDDPHDFSLDILADQGAKSGIRTFVETRVFISRLKADFTGAKLPENFDGSYLTMKERELLVRKFREEDGGPR